MDRISADDLEKYDDILLKIDAEYEKCQKLKKQIQKENDQILAVNIASRESDIRKKIFKISVKVFNNVFEIYDVLEQEISNYQFQSLLAYNECKFYLVEVGISHAFQDKILNQKCSLTVEIKNSKRSVNETMLVTKFSNPLQVIVPFENSLENCVVDTKLLIFSQNSWIVLKLETIEIDISYHFQSLSDTKITSLSLTSKILNIFNIYNKDLNLKALMLPQTIEYSFKCCCSSENFFTSFIQHCYHKLNIDLLTKLSKNENCDINLQVGMGDENKTIISYLPNDKILKIATTLRELRDVKKYFIKELKNRDLSIDSSVYPQLTVSFNLFKYYFLKVYLL